MRKKGLKMVILLVTVLISFGYMVPIAYAVENIGEQLKSQTMVIASSDTTVEKPSKEWLLSILDDNTISAKELTIAEPFTLFVQGDDAREDLLFPVLFRNQVFRLIRWNAVTKEFSLQSKGTAQGLNSFMDITTTEAPLVLFEKDENIFVRHKENIFCLSNLSLNSEQLEAIKNEYISFQFPTTKTMNIFQITDEKELGETSETETAVINSNTSLSESSETKSSTLLSESSETETIPDSSSEILDSSFSETSTSNTDTVVESETIEIEQSTEESTPSFSPRVLMIDTEGNTIEDAKAFDMNYSGTLEFPDDIDWLKVEVPTTGKYEINILSSVNIDYYLYGSSGDNIVAHKNNISSEKIEKILTKGTYYIKLTGRDFDIMGNYNIKLTQLENHEDDQEGNILEKAKVVDLNYAGGIDYEGDKDWLKFNVTSSGTYEIKITSELPLYYKLYGSSGSYKLTSKNDVKEMTQKLTLNKGSYYHQLSGFSTTAKGKYEIKFTQLDKHEDDQEGDILEKAKAVDLNYAGGIDYEGDKDWLKLTISFSGTYEIKITSELPLYYKLYGSSGSYKLTSKNNVKEMTQKLTLNKGTYYHQLSGFSTTAKGKYEIKITQLDKHEDDQEGDILEKAKAVDLNYAGGIDYEGDKDWLKLTISSSGTYEIKITSELPLYYKLYGSSGSYELTSKNNVKEMTQKLTLNEGTYYHQLSGFSTTAKGKYEIKITQLDKHEDDQEGDILEKAKAVDLNYAGGINYEGDKDWLKLTISSTGTYEIKVTSDFPMSYRLYGSAGTRDLFYNNNTKELTRKLTLNKGTYYQKLSGYYTADKGKYNIRITQLSKQNDDIFQLKLTQSRVIGPDQAVLGTTSEKDELEYWKIVIKHFGEYEIETTSETARMYSYLYDDSGVRVMCGGTYDKIKEKLYPGTYYLSVRNLDSKVKTADYQITIKTIIDYTKDDIGNTPETAKAIDTKEPFKGKMDYENDRDYVKFTIEHLGEYEIETTSETAQMYSYLYDDSGVRFLRGGTYDKIKEKLYPGTYYLSVRNLDSKVKTADYQITIKTIIDYTKDDIGNTPETAKAIDTKEPFKGKMDYENDRDYVKFTIEHLGEYEIETTSETAQMYSYLYDDSGVRFLRGGTYDKIKEKLYPGTYYLSVRNLDSKVKTADYQITIKTIIDYTKDDIGNTPETAKAIDAKEPFKGKMDYENDRDYVKFTIEHLGEYEIETTSETAQMYSYLYDDSGVRFLSGDTYDKIKEKLYPGTYYLSVRNLDSKVKTADYQITIKTIIDYTKDDIGNTPETAAVIGMNKEVSGEINYSNDVDYYKFTIQKTSTYYFSGDSKTLKLYANLYDDSGIRSISDRSNESNFLIKRKLIPGTYYLKIRSSSSDKGKYTLRIGKDDVGDSFDTAKNIKLNQLNDHKIDYPGDVDYYKLDLKEDELATYCNWQFSGEAAVKYTLYDGNKREYTQGDGSDGLTKLLIPDTYYLKVEGESPSTVGSYSHKPSIGELASEDIDISPYPYVTGNTFYMVFIKDELDQNLSNIYTKIMISKNWEDFKTNLSGAMNQLGNLLNQVVQIAGPTIGTGAALKILSIQGSYGGLALVEVGTVAGATAVSGGVAILVVGAAGLVALMVTNSSGEIQKPQVKTDYSNWQDKGIKPSKSRGGKPRGEYETVDNEGVRKQNETADYLANEGYDLEMLEYNPEGNGHGIKPNSSPDFKIEGKVFDCYYPTSSKTNNVIHQITEKTKKQTGNIVLNLDNYSTSQVDEILGMIQRKANPNGDLKRLTEILVIKSKQIIWKWTW
ncbi:hypothetical protein GIX45_02970 [Erwinia sp. CPCC 100877]|nr:hypothetical protein [Erwinia sp. CPCC 100877]